MHPLLLLLPGNSIQLRILRNLAILYSHSLAALSRFYVVSKKTTFEMSVDGRVTRIPRILYVISIRMNISLVKDLPVICMLLLVLSLLACNVVGEVQAKNDGGCMMVASLPRQEKFDGCGEPANSENSSVESKFPNLRLETELPDVRVYAQKSKMTHELLQHSGADNDRTSLLEFKRAIRNDSLGSVAGWNLRSRDFCTWKGVICNSEGRVLSISLPGSQLTGVISPSLGKLAFLSVLNLSANNFDGAIPSSLAVCTRLLTVDLSNNQLSGNIPSQLGNLTNLTILRLGDNPDLDGEIPPEIGQCGNLTTLELRKSKFSGGLPDSLGNCKMLVNLLVVYNANVGGSKVHCTNLFLCDRFHTSEHTSDCCHGKNSKNFPVNIFESFAQKPLFDPDVS